MLDIPGIVDLAPIEKITDQLAVKTLIVGRQVRFKLKNPALRGISAVARSDYLLFVYRDPLRIPASANSPLVIIVDAVLCHVKIDSLPHAWRHESLNAHLDF